MTDVRPLGPGEDEAWDAYLRSEPGGVLYYSTAYRDLLAGELGCEAEYLVAEDGGEIAGALPVMWSGEAGCRVCNSLPFYGSHGAPVASSAEASAALIAAWDERAADEGTVAATMVANPFDESPPPEPSHTLTDDRIGQVTKLPGPDTDELMALFSKNARRDVRRAERRGVQVEVDQDRLMDLAALHRANIEAIGGAAKAESFFEAVPRHFSAGQDFDVWVAVLDGVMIAGLLTFYFNGVAEYFTPASDRDHQADEPMALILLRAMAEAARKGCRLWNWGGTWGTQDGVHRFKAKWGAEDVPYRYFVRVNDDGLLDSTASELRARFPHFYVAPFSALRSPEAV